MLTFEKVFSVFESFLAENGIYEAVQTSRGHTILEQSAKIRSITSASEPTVTVGA